MGCCDDGRFDVVSRGMRGLKGGKYFELIRDESA